MTFPYTVQKGDFLSAIAKKFGIKTWQEIYRHRENAAFRRPSGLTRTPNFSGGHRADSSDFHAAVTTSLARPRRRARYSLTRRTRK